MGLDRIVSRMGLITFNDYKTKLRMMEHPLYLFGLKLYDMQGSVEFFDADFCNTLVVKSGQFENKSLWEVSGIINSYLLKNGFKGRLLEVGSLKDVSEEFKLENISVNLDFSIQLRFHNFPEAMNAYAAL